jgi:Lon protease-like protein
MSDDLASLEAFGGEARLFPLPNLVLFPAVVQPLHIFEPRYRALMADALAGDRLMALALLRPGWEEDYHLSPPVHSVVCLGKIFKEQLLPDGRYNLLLYGLARARILDELQTDKPYRSARVELLRDVEAVPAESAQALRLQLGDGVGGWLAAQSAALEQLRNLVHSNLDLGTLCDLAAFVLPLNVEVKQQLLEELVVERRVRRLLQHLEATPPPEGLKPVARKFPPDFSEN